MKIENKKKVSNNRGRNQNRNSKVKDNNKKIEINVKDGDLNAADIDPMERRDKRKRNRGNDPQWYTHYPVLAPNAAGVNFSQAVGSPIDYHEPNLADGAREYIYTAPGICNIHMIPTIGEASTTIESVANRVGAQIYTAERQKLGSVAQYDATDNMIYLGCMDSAYMTYAFAVKIYGCLRLATPYNFYYLKNIIESMGVDYNSFYLNMSQFRYDINQFAIFLSSRLVPSFDYFTRHIWLMQNIWTDSETAKAQLYNFVPDAYYIYTEVTDGPAYAALTPYPTTTNNKIGYDDIRNVFNQIVNSAIASTDIDQMSADIGKAFENEVVLLSLIPEDYMTPVSFSAEVLSQIENIRLMGKLYQNRAATTPITGDITQEVALPAINGPRVVQQLWTVINATSQVQAENATTEMMNGAIINFHKMDISYEDILVATRGISAFSRVAQVSETPVVFAGQIGTCGSEIFTYATLSMLNSTGSLTTLEYMYPFIVASQTAGRMQTSIALLSQWTTFDWAPAIKLYDTTTKILTRFQDLDMYATIDLGQLRAINNNCMFSLFYSDKLPKPLGN